MIDLVDMQDPPHFEQAQIELVRSRRNRKHRTPSATPWVIGAIILLDGGQTPCRIVALDPEPLCVPVTQ